MLWCYSGQSSDFKLEKIPQKLTFRTYIYEDAHKNWSEFFYSYHKGSLNTLFIGVNHEDHNYKYLYEENISIRLYDEEITNAKQCNLDLLSGYVYLVTEMLGDKADLPLYNGSFKEDVSNYIKNRNEKDAQYGIRSALLSCIYLLCLELKESNENRFKKDLFNYRMLLDDRNEKIYSGEHLPRDILNPKNDSKLLIEYLVFICCSLYYHYDNSIHKDVLKDISRDNVVEFKVYT